MSKKKQTKNNSYYNPRYAAGYNILNNLAAFERVGTAILSHDRELANKIDSSASEWRRRNAEELDWEDKKQQIRKTSDQIIEHPFSFGAGLMAKTSIAGARMMNDSLGAIANHEVPGMPEDYGMSDFLKDQWNSFFGEMNHLQAEDARGYQTRALNDKSLIDSYMRSLDILDEIETIDFRLNELRSIDTTGFTQKQTDNLNSELNKLIAQKTNLQKTYKSLEKDRQLLEDTVSQSGAGRVVDDLLAGNNYYGKGGITGIFGKTTALHDEINDARRFMWNLTDPSLTNTQKKKLLSRALKEYDKLNGEWQQIIDENEADQKKYQDKVSAWYKGREAKAGTDFFDPDTYLFKMPGILGGSSSSYMKLIPGMLAGMIAGIAAPELSLPAAVSALTAGGGTSFAFMRGAGISENNAEVALAAIEKIKDRTGLSDKEIQNIISGKDTDPAKLRKIQENIRNTENLFNADMAATTWDAAIDAALNTMPIGAIASAGKYIKGTKAFSKAMSNPVMRKVLESKLGSDFVKGWNAASVGGIGVGVVGGAANATVGRGAREAAKKFGNFIVRTADDTSFGAIAHDLWKETNLLGRAALNLNPAELAARKAMIGGTRATYAKDIAGRLIRSGISEGIEEGKQHINAERFKNGQLDDKLMGTFDVAFTDMLSGLKSGAYVLGIPLDGLGLIDIKDKELLAEIKGGMLGGWGHTATVNVLREAPAYIRQQRANEIVLEQMQLNKLESQANFKQYKQWLKKGLFNPGYNDVLAAFDRLRSINEDYNNQNDRYGIKPELIDEAENKYKRVINIAQSRNTREEAEAMGIKVRDIKNPSTWKSNEEYHEYVAAKAIALDKVLEKENLRNAARANRIKADAEIDRRHTILNDDYLEETLSELQSHDSDTDLEQYRLDEENDLRKEFGLSSERNRTEKMFDTIEKEQGADAEYTKRIAYLAALLRYRDQIEQGLDAQKNNPHARVRNGLKEQLKSLNAKIDFWTKHNESFARSIGLDLGNKMSNYTNASQSIKTLDDVESHLVYNQEEHEILRDAYEEELKWQDEYQSSLNAYYDLIGRRKVDENGNVTDEIEKPGNAKKVLSDIHEMEKGDDDFERLIEQVYQEDLKAEHLNDRNGWQNPEIAPKKIRPVNNANGDLVRVQFNEQGVANRNLADNEFIDDLGYVWERLDFNPKDPFKEAVKPRPTKQMFDEEVRRAFRDTWNKETGTVLPLTPEGMQERNKQALLEKAALSGSAPPTPSNDEAKPPIEPPTPPAVPTNAADPEKTPQQETLDMLDKKYKSDKDIVLKGKDGYDTTGQDYFVLIEGKPTRMSRVHNVKPQSYFREDEDKQVKTLQRELLNAGTYSELNDIILTKVSEKSQHDVNVYLKYIDDNRTIFFGNPTKESAKEYQETLLHLAQVLIERTPGNSVRMGNVVDELARNFFGSNVLFDSTQTEDGIISLFNSINESEGKSYSDLFNDNIDSFRNLIDALRKQYIYYKQTLGWELRALPFTWKAHFDNVGWVAGETDLIGVDAEGRIHIIDFKTSYKTFGIQYFPNIELTSAYASDLNIVREDDFKNGKPNKKARTVLRNIKEDSGRNDISILWNSDLNRAVIVYKNRPFVSITNAEKGQVLSPYEDYSNQQTAYAEMISLESGGDVASIEILPFVCSYDGREFRIIYKIDLEERIPLMLSKQMRDILTGVTDQTEQAASALRNNITQAYRELVNKQLSLANKITDDVFNELSDNGKLIFSDYFNAVSNIIIPVEDDIQALETVLDEINGLLENYQSIVDGLREDIRNERSKQAVQSEQEAKKTQRDSHKQDEQSVSTIYATNKRDSAGNTSHANLNYRLVGNDRSLELATSSPGFITDADFSLYTEGEKVFVDISYQGSTWKHVEIDTKYNGTWIPNGKLLFDQVKRLEAENPGKKIVPLRSTMNRTNGRIKLAVDDKGDLIYLPISKTDLFSGEDIYDIEFSAAYGNLGFIDDSGQAVTFDQKDTQRKPVYIWGNPKFIPKKGTLIYTKHIRKNEANYDSIIPIAIDRVKLKENDVEFILELLKNPDMLDKEYYVEQDGNVYRTHTTGRKLASLMIPIVDDANYLGNITSIFRDPANPNIIRLMNRADFAANSNGRGVFDISIQKEHDELKKQLMDMSIAENHDVLLSRLGNDRTESLPFDGIRKTFVENNSGTSTLTKLQITETLGFDLDDFKTVTSQTGVLRHGLSGFGFYLKHNMLCTQYAGMGSCNVEIRDAMLEDSTPDVSANGIQSVPENPIGAGVNTQTEDSEIETFFLNKITDTTKKRRKLSKTKALRHIREILGDNVPVEFEQDFLKVIGGTAHVVGNCKSDAIVLSQMAWPGVEYHEAFHRIFEMLIPASERNAISKKVADRLGVRLYNEDGSENKDAFRQVAEYVADRYMEHMNRHWNDIKIPFLTKIYNKIHGWVSMLVHFKNRDLYKTFIKVNRGEYKSAMPTKEAIDRFDRLYKELYAQIHGVDFEHIVNRPMYDELRKSVVFCITQGFPVDSSGRNIVELGRHITKETFKIGIDKLLKAGYDVIGQNTETPSVGQLAMRELYDKFDNENIKDDIANDISILSTDFVKIREEESDEDAQGDDVTAANIGEHTRSPYEFSRFEKTSSRVRFFFATIPDTTYREVKTVEDGKQTIKKVPVLALNEFGLPQYIPVNTAFNEFLNFFHDIDSLSELSDRLEYLAKEDSMYKTIYLRIFGKTNGIYRKTYSVEDGKVVRNSDYEALLSQLMNVIRSHKHAFDIARSDTKAGQYGQYTITIQPTDTDYNATFYPTQWNLMLVNGGTPILKLSQDGTLEFSKSIKNASSAFARISRLFTHPAEIVTAENGSKYYDVGIKQWLDNAFVANPQPFYLKLNVNGSWGYYSNPNDPARLEVVKDKIVEALNTLGIQFGVAELNYMLLHKYGSTDAKALSYMFDSVDIKDSMSSFITFLNSAVINGTIRKSYNINGKSVELKDVYGNFAFIRELANWKYQYRHSHDQLTVLATNNNKFYEISDNNYVSDVVRSLNKRNQSFQELISGTDPYIYLMDTDNVDVFGKTPVYGSLILDELVRNPNTFITLRNFVGFKTDKKNDTGEDYFQISRQEDYVSKAVILERGGIIMPTLSDKKTYMYLDGIKLPGLDYSNTIDRNGNVIPFSTLGDQFVISKDPVSLFENMLSQDQDVIDRFMSYALSEYRSVKKADADLDIMDANGTRNSDVDNYYTKEQGAKFASLLGVWEYKYKKAPDGSMIVVGEVYHSFNDSKKTRKQNIAEAEKYFFNRTREEQEMLILRLLHKRLLKEIDTCVDLGLIEKVGDSENIFENYNNVGLNSTAIKTIYLSLVAKNGEPVDQKTIDKYKSLATIIYINDISNKAIISGQEIERVFSGNPAFYKWNYDQRGNLIDRSIDELKRLGGLVSTGNNNFLELKDVPAKYLDSDGNFTGEYVAAQVNNEMVQSPLISEIEERMKYGEIATAAYITEEKKALDEFRTHWQEVVRIAESNDPQKAFAESDYFASHERPEETIGDVLHYYNESREHIYELEQDVRKRVSENIDSKTIEELEEMLSPTVKAIALRKAEEATESYRKDIDVADGSAYITDTMAEMLLRMNGNYNSSVEKAFKILREETPSTILEKQSAYQDVLTSVIGTYKYTAFGYRKHTTTGIQVAYYNKMALFPMFQCMSTGRMLNIFNKMKQQGIDMLMVDSAVKLGGQGSKSINWDQYSKEDGDGKPTFAESFDFDTYRQKFMYLRKQLNTDPKEESMMKVGTQMTKVVMTNLFDGRTYYMQDGTEISGVELRDDIMNAINELSDRGLRSIQQRFFKTDKSGNLLNSDGEIINEDDINQKNKLKVLDEVKFSKEVRKLLMTKDPDKNILDAIELVDQVDSDGVTRKHMRLPLNAISNSNWLESILISDINSHVIDINTPGAAFIQRSVWAMEGSSLLERRNGSIIGDENLPKDINGGNRLLMINEEGSMDCVLSADFFKKMFKGDLPKVPIKDKNRNVVWDLIPKRDARGNAIKDEAGKPVYVQRRDKDGNLMFDSEGKPVYKRLMRMREMTFDELRRWLINRNIIGPNATANIVAYRIPTQAESSIHALRCVDILPVVNDTVILPEEFTKITGSDYDIDKLFLSSIQYAVKRQKGEDDKFHQTVTDQFEQKSDSYYQNKLIRDYITLLLDSTSKQDKKQRSANFLHRSIDNDTKLLKSIVKDLYSGVNATIEEPYGFYSLSTQTAAKDDYITGKIGIGPFALNNNNHVLTMMYHVKFKHVESSIMSELGLEDLDNRVDKNGESIMSWLSALINAHVDIAKDPYISRMNVNSFTYNLVNLLVRTGLGDKSFYFINQPVIRHLAKAYINAGSMYMADPYSSKYTLQNEAIEQVAQKWFDEFDYKFEGRTPKQLIDAIKEGGVKNADLRTKVNKKIKQLFDESIKDDAKAQNTNLENQLFYYLTYLQFDRYAKALSSLVTYSKIDTKKHGKSVTEQLVYEDGFNKTYDLSRDTNLFDPVGLSHMLNDSYIGKKTNNALSSVKDILGEQFIQSTPAFIGSVHEILRAIGRAESLSAPLVQKVANALSAAIKSQFFNDEYVPTITDDVNYIKNLVSGNNTIYDRFMKLLVAIHTDPAYRELLNPAGEIENRLLSMLVPGTTTEYMTSWIPGEVPDTYPNLKFVKFFNFIEDGGNTANYIIDAWDELLNYTSDNKEVENTIREFARDLVVYGFITSGDRGGFTKIFKYVPVSWRENSGYGNFIRNKLIEYSIGSRTDIDIDDVILNNWFDNEFVRTYKLKDPKTKLPNFMQYKTKVNGVAYGFPTMLAAIKPDENGQYVPSIDPTNAPKYIKISRRRDKRSYNSQRRFTIYKLHGIATSTNGVDYPVYIKTNPKGNQVSGGFVVTEYGRNDASYAEYAINEDVLRSVYQATTLGLHIQLVKRAEPVYASILTGLNKYWNKEQEQGLIVDKLKEDNKFDDSEFSDDAMNHCKT